VPILTKYRFIT